MLGWVEKVMERKKERDGRNHSFLFVSDLMPIVSQLKNKFVLLY